MEFIKKNIFWIGSFLLTVTMIGAWFYSTGALQAATASRESELKGLDSTAGGVISLEAEEGAGVHPNKETEAGMDEKIDKLAESVVAAWQLRYNAQRNVMKWPEAILTPKFMKEFNKYDPPETLPADETGQRIDTQTLLKEYKQQIPSQMKNICSIIQTNWKYEEQLDKEAFVSSGDSAEDSQGDGEAGDAPGNGDEDDENSNGLDARKKKLPREIVEWNSLNQDLWFQKLTNFLYRDDNQFQIRIPSPSQVYMLQQDLWLLEAMFDIIRNVNGQMDGEGNAMVDADGKSKMVLANDLATVKKIDHVVFGREALGLLGELLDPETTGEEGLATGGGRGRSSGGRGGRGTESNDKGFGYYGEPAWHGRYVDAKLDPIKSETIQKVFGETSLPEENLELVVAKRVPVRLAVQMDEREIPRFLAACANSPFAFEVWQVRINKHQPDEKIGLRGGPEDDGNSRGGVGGLSGQGGSGFGDQGGGKKRATKVALRKNYDVGVEFYGIVKIYNPVKAELITGKKAEAVSTP